MNLTLMTKLGDKKASSHRSHQVHNLPAQTNSHVSFARSWDMDGGDKSSGKRSNLLLDSLFLLLLGQLLFAVLLALGLPFVLALLVALILILLEGVLTDGSVSLAVEFFQTISLDIVVDVLAELGLVALLIVIS